MTEEGERVEVRKLRRRVRQLETELDQTDTRVARMRAENVRLWEALRRGGQVEPGPAEEAEPDPLG